MSRFFILADELPNAFGHSYYKSLTFYLQEQPTLLNDLLTVLIPRIDHARVVRMFQHQNNDNVPLIKPYLIAVQHVCALPGT